MTRGGMKIIALSTGAGGRVPTRQCEAEGCSRSRCGSKPYCLEHVALQPYVSALLAQLTPDRVDQME